MCLEATVSPRPYQNSRVFSGFAAACFYTILYTFNSDSYSLVYQVVYHQTKLGGALQLGGLSPVSFPSFFDSILTNLPTLMT